MLYIWQCDDDDDDDDNDNGNDDGDDEDGKKYADLYLFKSAMKILIYV